MSVNLTEKTDRNYWIEFLRFLFCFLIINYHFYSHFLRNLDFPNYFIRSYMGDEFFFIITGFYLSKSAIFATKDSIEWNIKQIIKRIKKIAIPYYTTWIFCFLGIRFTRYFFGKTNRSIFLDVANSSYELLFLKMCGLKKGLFSNDVAWFFSALLIVCFVLGPLIAKYKNRFSLYFAPLIAIFAYGALSLNYDYLHSPFQVVPNTFVLKGLIRALAAICIGSFLNGIVESNVLNYCYEKSKPLFRRIICLMDLMAWSIIVFYMVYPFKSNTDKLSIQYDYIIVILMAIALLPILCNIWRINGNSSLALTASKLGKYAFFAFFGQAILYSVDKILYAMNMGVLYKALILNLSVAVVSIILWVFTHRIKVLFK